MFAPGLSFSPALFGRLEGLLWREASVLGGSSVILKRLSLVRPPPEIDPVALFG